MCCAVQTTFIVEAHNARAQRISGTHRRRGLDLDRAASIRMEVCAAHS